MSARAKQVEKDASQTRKRIGNTDVSNTPEPKVVPISTARQNSRGGNQKSIQEEGAQPIIQRRISLQVEPEINPKGKNVQLQHKEEVKKINAPQEIQKKQVLAQRRSSELSVSNPQVQASSEKVQEGKVKILKNNDSKPVVKPVPQAEVIKASGNASSNSTKSKSAKEAGNFEKTILNKQTVHTKKSDQTKSYIAYSPPPIRGNSRAQRAGSRDLKPKREQTQELTPPKETKGQKNSAKALSTVIGKEREVQKQQIEPVVVKEVISKRNTSKKLTVDTEQPKGQKMELQSPATPPSPAPSPAVQKMNKNSTQPISNEEKTDIRSDTKQTESTMQILQELKQKLFVSTPPQSIKKVQQASKEDKKIQQIQTKFEDINEKSKSVAQGKNKKDSSPKEIVIVEAVPASEGEALKKRGRKSKDVAPVVVQEQQKGINSKNRDLQKVEVIDDDVSEEQEAEITISSKRSQSQTKSSKIDGRIVPLEKPPSMVQGDKDVGPPPGTFRHLIHDLSYLLEQASDISKSMTEHVENCKNGNCQMVKPDDKPIATLGIMEMRGMKIGKKDLYRTINTDCHNGSKLNDQMNILLADINSKINSR